MFVPLVLPEALITLPGAGEGGRPGGVQAGGDARKLARVELLLVLLAVGENGLLLDDLRPQAVDGDVRGDLRLGLALLRVARPLRLVLQLAGGLHPALREDVVEAGGAALAFDGRRKKSGKANGDDGQQRQTAKSSHLF